MCDLSAPSIFLFQLKMASILSIISPGQVLHSCNRGDGGVSLVTKAVTVSPQTEKSAKKIISVWLGLSDRVCVHVPSID